MKVFIEMYRNVKTKSRFENIFLFGGNYGNDANLQHIGSFEVVIAKTAI